MHTASLGTNWWTLREIFCNTRKGQACCPGEVDTCDSFVLSCRPQHVQVWLLIYHNDSISKNGHLWLKSRSFPCTIIIMVHGNDLLLSHKWPLENDNCSLRLHVPRHELKLSNYLKFCSCLRYLNQTKCSYRWC